MSSSFGLVVLLVSICLGFSANSVLAYTSFVFGDSLVDVGNNDYLLTLARADFPPYGIDFAASGGRPTGRFTNGRTIPDIIGDELGEPNTSPPAYLAISSSTSANHAEAALFRGMNYASGASGILDKTGSMFIERVSLSSQVKYFEQTREHMKSFRGENCTRAMLKDAMFSVTIGSNDILDYLQPPIPFLDWDWEEFGAKKQLPPTEIQDAMVGNLTMYLKRLQDLGARKFMVTGVGPLGCIPHVRALMLNANGCSMAANAIVQGYNAKLRRALGQLNREFGPDSMFVYGDAYHVLMDVITNHRQYGFVNADTPCCGSTSPPKLCLQISVDDKSEPCEDRSKYVFWDAYHPTDAANHHITKRLLEGVKGSTYPISVRRLHHYQT